MLNMNWFGKAREMRDDGVRDNAAGMNEETRRRGEMFLRALPIFLIPVAATILVALIVGTLAGVQRKPYRISPGI
jgi:hypothetical protein